MIRSMHAIAGGAAMLLMSAFWLSTAASEMAGSAADVVAVKTAILWGLLLLVPALAVTGGTGVTLARGRRGGLIGAKRARMPFIAANGLLILVPAAFYLAGKAQAGAFDGTFYFVQALELVAGAVNVGLLALNMRDGLRLHRFGARRAGT